MMEFTFEESPWELTLKVLHPGDTISAVRCLSLLEAMTEEETEEALLALEERGIALDISDLPMDKNEAILEKIRSCHPDILLVGFGFPLQEQWMCDNLSALPFLQVAAGLGGSFDVWAGDVRRAPRAIRALGMEWAWRMLFQPHRLRHLPAVFHAAFYR